MGEELKPKSFRITEETADKFKEIAGSIGGNQQEVLAKLIEAYEFQAGKNVLTDKREDIEQFEKYAGILTSMFLRSLEDNQNLSATIRTEYDSMLISKDATIADLQDQLKTAKELKANALETAKEKTNETAALSQTIDSLNQELKDKINNYESILSDKESLILALKDAGNELKEKNESMIEEHEAFAKMKVSLQNCEKEKEKKETEVENLTKEISDIKKQQKVEISNLNEKNQLEQNRISLQLKEEFQEKLQKEKEKHQGEIDMYQEKYLTLLNVVEKKTSGRTTRQK